MQKDDRAAWYCMRSKTKREHIAAAFVLQQCEIEVFAPRIPVLRKTRHGRRTFLEALFPGYFFARFCWGQSGRRILATQGVTGVVRFGQNAPVVPDGVIADLQMAVVEVASSDDHGHGLEEGEIVEILNGCFKGAIATVRTASRRPDRVSVLIDFLGRSLTLDVARSSIVPCEGDQTCVPDQLLRSCRT